MNRRILVIAVFALTASLLLPTSLVGNVNVPNPDRAIFVTIGMPETVDPHWAYDTASGTLIQNIYEPLCIFNVTDAASFLPAIADDWPGLGTAPGNAIIPSPPDPAPAGRNSWTPLRKNMDQRMEG